METTSKTDKDARKPSGNLKPLICDSNTHKAIIKSLQFTQ